MVKEIAPVIPRGFHISPKTEFKKGLSPWNKGKSWPEMVGENHPSRNPKYKAIFEKTWKQAKGIMRGKDHPMWKGGKTPLIMKIRNHKKSIEWREKIFKRDNYTCKICGDNKGGNLNAHHYIQVADIIHALGIKSLEEALQVPILWKLSNGIALCQKCHKIADEASKTIKQLYGGCYE